MKLMQLVALLGPLALAACASAPSQEAVASATGAAAAAPVPPQAMANQPLTGSRIPGRQSTDRLLKAVGNQDYRDSTLVKSYGNTLHAAGD